MSFEWNQRAEILALAHRWPLPVLAILIGGLLGWGFSLALPTDYRAEVSLSVAYNGDFATRNPDDYKNWQMGELNTFVFSDEVLQETADRLRQDGSAWQDLTAEDLPSMLHTYWRNAGRWRLVAVTSTPQRAAQLVQTWQQVVLELVEISLSHGRAMLELRPKIQAVTAEQIQTEMRITELTEVQHALQNWSASVEQGDGDQTLTILERWHLQTLVARAANLNPAGQELLRQPPPAESAAQEYLPWIERTSVLVEDELHIIGQQQLLLGAQHNDLADQWTELQNASRGLSGYLSVNPLESLESNPQPVRSAGQAALIGGIFGFLGWGLVWLGGPTLKIKK